jgi:Zn-finger nucleic acid-binding protein
MANCLNCGAPMRLDTVAGVLACTHCGSIDAQPSVVDLLDISGSSETSCPICATPLAQARLGSYPLQVCRQCEGMLIEMTHFVDVIETARFREQRRGVVLPREQHPGHRTFACPQCGGPMLNHVYGGPGNIVIDTCEGCQVNWLDAGELRRIARAR